jgi:Zn-dependent peptidase ImmA (M78 family)
MPTIFQAIREAQKQASSGPVDLDALASRLGIRIERRWMDDDMSGALIRNSDGTFTIQVNDLHPLTRQRFTVAHEMGHFVHHRHLLGDGVNDSRAYRTDRQHAYYNARIGPQQETEANKFAASLLMPADVVSEMLEAGMSVDAMAKHLGVSRHAMSIRAGVPYETA